LSAWDRVVGIVLGNQGSGGDLSRRSACDLTQAIGASFKPVLCSESDRMEPGQFQGVETQQGRRVGNRRPCNRWACGALRSRAKRSLCDALPSVAMTMTGRACLAAPYDVHDCPSQFVGQRSIRPSKASPTGDDVESQNEQLAKFIF
jgi:hypothetical protein